MRASCVGIRGSHLKLVRHHDSETRKGQAPHQSPEKHNSVAILQATWQSPHSSLWVRCLASCGPGERAAPSSTSHCLLLDLSLQRDSSMDTLLSCRPRSPSPWPCLLLVPQSLSTSLFPQPFLGSLALPSALYVQWSLSHQILSNGNYGCPSPICPHVAPHVALCWADGSIHAWGSK